MVISDRPHTAVACFVPGGAWRVAICAWIVVLTCACKGTTVLGADIAASPASRAKATNGVSGAGPSTIDGGGYSGAAPNARGPESGLPTGAPDAGSMTLGDVVLLPPPMPVGPCSIAVGRERSCAADSTGTLWCWGRDPLAQGLDHVVPTIVPGLGGVTRVALGAAHICAIAAGRVFCWGDNASGQLGDGTDQPHATPRAVPGIADAVEIAAGARNTCAVHVDGELTCWGDNASQQLGDASADAGVRSLLPVHVLDGVQRIAIGNGHVCVFGMGLEARCWGDNSSGQLGDGSSRSSATPVGVGLDASDLAAGDGYTCATAGDGSVHCWGSNMLGQLGDGSMGDSIAGTKAIGRTSPVQTQGVALALAVRAGSAQSCALLASGEVRCWGANQFGLLGHGGDVAEIALTAQPATFLDPRVTQLALASEHACALFSGSLGVMCWGANTYGQLGNGKRAAPFDPSNPDSTRPVPVLGFSGCK